MYPGRLFCLQLATCHVGDTIHEEEEGALVRRDQNLTLGDRYSNHGVWMECNTTYHTEP